MIRPDTPLRLLAHYEPVPAVVNGTREEYAMFLDAIINNCEVTVAFRTAQMGMLDKSSEKYSVLMQAGAEAMELSKMAIRARSSKEQDNLAQEHEKILTAYDSLKDLIRQLFFVAASDLCSQVERAMG